MKHLSRLILTALIICIVVISATALTGCDLSIEEPTEGLVFTFDDLSASYVVSGYNGTSENVIIPSTYQGYPVQSIGEQAFWLALEIKSITIPKSVTHIENKAFIICPKLESITVAKGNEKYHSSKNCLIETASKTLVLGCKNSVIPTNGSVTSIGDYAFHGCTGLTSITIPDSVTRIGDYAFVYCGRLTNITIPSSVTSIGTYAFSGCSGLTSITIPDSVISIGNRAFDHCEKLTSVTIGKGVESVGNEAFVYCDGLESITVVEGNVNYHSAENCLIETESKKLIFGCKNSIIPTNGSVTSIGDWAFYSRDGLTSITIPDSVTSIGWYAFQFCSELTDINIPDSVTSIGDYAFHGCTGLTSITIPDSVTSIGNHAFGSCSGIIQQENGISYVDKWVVDCNNNVVNANLKANTVGIAGYAFLNCSKLTSITIPNSVKNIGENVFYLCSKLTNIYYGGTASEWNEISIGSHNIELTDATLYCYCETEPAVSGNYWHYVDGVPTVW